MEGGAAAGRSDEEERPTCSVCLGVLADAEPAAHELPCKHRFHRQCISLWLRKHSSCPCCRAQAAEPAAEGRSGRICASGFTAGADPQIRASFFTASRESFTAGVDPKISASGFTGDADRQRVRASGFTSTESQGKSIDDERIRASGFSSVRDSLQKKDGPGASVQKASSMAKEEMDGAMATG